MDDELILVCEEVKLDQQKQEKASESDQPKAEPSGGWDDDEPIDI